MTVAQVNTAYALNGRGRYVWCPDPVARVKANRRLRRAR